MCGCLIFGVLVVLLFAVVPVWPLLLVGLIVLAVIAAALGLLWGILGAMFGRR